MSCNRTVVVGDAWFEPGTTVLRGGEKAYLLLYVAYKVHETFPAGYYRLGQPLMSYCHETRGGTKRLASYFRETLFSFWQKGWKYKISNVQNYCFYHIFEKFVVPTLHETENALNGLLYSFPLPPPPHTHSPSTPPSPPTTPTPPSPTPPYCPCRSIGAEVLIDDNPAYALECAQAGIHVLLYDWDHAYPWSKTPGGGPTHDLITRWVRWWCGGCGGGAVGCLGGVLSLPQGNLLLRCCSLGLGPD